MFIDLYEIEFICDKGLFDSRLNFISVMEDFIKLN